MTKHLLIAAKPTMNQTMSAKRDAQWTTTYGCSRDYGENQHVYLFFSHRIRGLGVGVELNPDAGCGADCTRCVACRSEPAHPEGSHLEQLAGELKQTLTLVFSGQLAERTNYRSLPRELLRLQCLVMNIQEGVKLPDDLVDQAETILCVRARGNFPFFKLVLQAHHSSLVHPAVQKVAQLLTTRDEIWLRLDGGTDAYLAKVGHAPGSLNAAMADILSIAKERPVILQSLFPVCDGQEPPASEIEAYIHRLQELKEAGARVPLVQIISATPTSTPSRYGHLPLKKLSAIARRVQQESGLRTEIC